MITNKGKNTFIRDYELITELKLLYCKVNYLEDKIKVIEEKLKEVVK